MPYKAYAANFAIEIVYLSDRVLLIDQKGVGNIYTFFECPKETKLIKFDEIAIC